ncbi:hypothetical protein ACFFHJ_36750 [Planotetraspora thailandica]|nr:hypothetical protein [Planotetraspora thailandica]
MGCVIALAVLLLLTLQLLMPSRDQADLSTAAAPSPSDSQPATFEQVEEVRFPPGTALPLTVDQETRDQLSAAARAVVDPSGPAKRAVEVATGGVIYFGEIYGKTPDTDVYYVLASIDRLYFWKQQGNGPWVYQGDYDATSCTPPIPRALNAAWGAPFGGGPTPNALSMCTQSP